MYMCKLIITKSQEEILRISVKLYALLHFVFHNIKKTTSLEILVSRMAALAQNAWEFLNGYMHSNAHTYNHLKMSAFTNCLYAYQCILLPKPHTDILLYNCTECNVGSA